jgi:cobalt-zinc-cadmium efflux system membrane fusion protein
MASLYPGTIKGIYVNTGDRITKGQLLASVNSIDFIETQQQYLMVLHQIGMLEQEYERQKELNKDKISSDKYFQRARADYQVALTELNALKLQLKMAGVDTEELANGQIVTYHDITSPINGYIENVFVNPGKYVNPDESLFQIINRDHLIIELYVFEKDIMKVSEGQRITFTLSNMSDRVYEANITSVGNTVSGDARIVKVLAEFRNEGGRLLPGMFVASEIHTGENHVTALPEDAVIRIGNDEYIIFYTMPDMQREASTYFDFAEVKIGNAEDGYIEIELISPIPENAMVVISGGYYLKTEMAKQEE